MKQRIITATALLLIVAFGFVFEAFHIVLVLLALFLALACVWELEQMYRPKGVRGSLRTAMLGVTALVYLGWIGRMEWAVLVLGGVFVLAVFSRVFRGEIEGAWRDETATMGATLYIGVPLGLLIELFRTGAEGRLWLLFMLTIVWATDTMALVVGKNFGRYKIFPKLSPGKTWEGSLGGLVGAMFPGLFAILIFPQVFNTVSIVELVLVSLCVSILTQFGDVAESMLKRDAGVKDSGRLLAGHGGALDRLDSILMTTVPFVIYLQALHPEIFLSPI